MNFLDSSKKWIYPLVLFIIFTPFSPWLDLAVTRYFYSIGNDPVEHFVSSPLLDFIFNWGTFPANLTAFLSVVFLVLSYIFTRFKSFRNPCLVLILTYALGAGMITNGILKEYWGRPRPKQVEEFGGTQNFRPYFMPNFHQPQPSKSFPCGHCSMGYFFFALALVGRRLQNTTLFSLGLILAFGLGIILSLTRIAQGGHFLSDTLFSALLMWYVALAMDWLVYSGEEFP